MDLQGRPHEICLQNVWGAQVQLSGTYLASPRHCQQQKQAFQKKEPWNTLKKHSDTYQESNIP